MRDLIDKTQKLFEMPSLMAGRIDFGLSNPDDNRAMADECHEECIEKIEDTPKYLLGRCGATEDSGRLFLYNKGTGHLDYYVEFVVYNKPLLGRMVTQIALWRKSGGVYPGITKKVFFDVLLARHAGVMSDGTQSYDGQRFWLDRMQDARQLGFVVGLRTDKGDFICDTDDVSGWSENLDAWAENSPEHEQKRFFVVNER